MEVQSKDLQAKLDSTFNQTTMMYLMVFLVVYFIMYYWLLGKASSSTTSTLILSRFIDVSLLGILIAVAAIFYYGLPSTDKSNLIGWILNYSVEFFNDPFTCITLVPTIVFFYIIVYVCKVPMTEDTKPTIIMLIEKKLWILFFLTGFIDFMKYVFNINLAIIIFGTIAAIWNNLPEEKNKTSILQDVSGNEHIDSSNNIIKVVGPTSEVFNVSNNLYTYDEANSVCKALDTRLATYEEVEESYNDGGEWCSYGWSEGQMALFPTQKKTWDDLQKTEKHKNDCGRQGINGGYFANPNVKFGVNCFGVKPKPNKNELAMMNSENLHPKSPEDIAIDAKVQYWKDNADSLLVLNPFNKSKWNEY